MSATLRFGTYDLIAELGQGGMADVFLAVPEGPASLGVSKLLVLKRLRKEIADELEFVTMFVDEGRLAARLSHPNIVQTYEIGEFDGVYYMTMEYLDGQPLDRILRYAGKAGDPLPIRQMLRIYAEVLEGLHCAHELRGYDGTPLGVVHRDVSPQNIFITYDGQVKVVDFGIAKARGRLSRTREGVVKGKPVYMSPEQASAKDVDRRADVFAVGLMLWETLTERRPWEGLKEIDIVTRLIKRDLPKPPSSVREGVESALDAICAKALAAKLDERFASAEEMSQAIYRYLQETGGLPLHRELGDAVAKLFAARRKELGDVIAATLAQRERSSGPHLLAQRLAPSSLASKPKATPAIVEEEPTMMPTATKPKSAPALDEEDPTVMPASTKPKSGPAIVDEESTVIRPSPRNQTSASVSSVPAMPARREHDSQAIAKVPGRNGSAKASPPFIERTSEPSWFDRKTLVIGVIALILSALVGIGGASLLDKPAPASGSSVDASSR
jgi:serine/threonine protein kinase